MTAIVPPRERTRPSQDLGCISVMTVIIATATIQSRQGTRPDDPAATGFGTVPTPTSMEGTMASETDGFFYEYHLAASRWPRTSSMPLSWPCGRRS